MKPISLTLRGFIGIKKGMGQDEVTLDLSELSGLIAFDGKNGSGKTTILDNLHAYRRLASRDGSLQHHVFLRDSYKEYTFDFNGHQYRTLVKIDAHSGRQEGYIWKDGEPQVSGKATEYDKYIENLLGSPKLFFQSVFAAQGGDSIADMTTGELKNLFSEFLRLDKLAEYEETAKQAGNAIAEQIKTIQQRIETETEKTAQANSLNEELEAAQISISHRKQQAESVREEINTVSKELDAAREKAAGHKAALERSTEIDKQIESKQATIEKARKEFEFEMQAHWTREKELNDSIAEKDELLKSKNQHQQLSDELRQLENANTQKERDLEMGGREYDFTVKDIEDKRKAWEQYHEAAIKDIEAQNKHVYTLEKQKDETEKAVSAKKTEIQQLENDPRASKLQQEIVRLQQTADMLSTRHPDCPVNPDNEDHAHTCGFIVDCIESKRALPEKEKEYEQVSAEIRGKIAQATDELDGLKETRADLVSAVALAEEKYEALRKEYDEHKANMDVQISDMAKARDAAKAYNDQLAKEIQANRRRISEIKIELDNQPNFEVIETERRQLTMSLSDLKSNWNKRTEDHKQQIEVLQQEVESLQKQRLELPLDYEAEQAVEDKSMELERLKGQADMVAAEISKLDSRIAVLDHQLKEIAGIEDRIGAEQQKIEALNKELSEWRYIQNACGKDGLRALEIDGTAPLIAGYANDLLTATFGPGSTVGFRTLNDDGKECLDVVVYREDDQDENGTLLENLSGGQKVWVLKALRLALTLVSKEKSGKDIAAALSDEEDGALDAESAVSFIGLYRAFMEAGGFDSCLYITHRDACKSMADHVIRLTGKGIEVDSGMARAA